MVRNIFRFIKSCCSKSLLGIVDRLQIGRIFILTEMRERRILKMNYPDFTLNKDINEAEKKWKEYWKPILKHPGKWSYRLFSSIDGHDVRILSQVLTIELEKSLNPENLLSYYLNKNMFEKILPTSLFPTTILRVMDNIFMDRDYSLINNLSDEGLSEMLESYESVILKPTVDSNSGNGILKFIRKGKVFVLNNDTDVKLSVNMIQNIGGGGNMILQESLKQHSFMSQFNPTSVNTIRIATYTSPHTGEVNLLSAIIRMGAKGAYVDNMHADGKMVGVDVNTGILTKFCLDVNSKKYSSYNEVDFEHNQLLVPEWNKIVEFTKDVAKRLFPMKLIQFDIAIEEDGNIKLIEYNMDGFPMWVAQYFGFPAFGKYTDEIRDYAMGMKKSLDLKVIRERCS